jgi:hypothetical protein
MVRTVTGLVVAGRRTATRELVRTGRAGKARQGSSQCGYGTVGFGRRGWAAFGQASYDVTWCGRLGLVRKERRGVVRSGRLGAEFLAWQYGLRTGMAG